MSKKKLFTPFSDGVRVSSERDWPPGSFTVDCLSLVVDSWLPEFNCQTYLPVLQDTLLQFWERKETGVMLLEPELQKAMISWADTPQKRMRLQSLLVYFGVHPNSIIETMEANGLQYAYLDEIPEDDALMHYHEITHILMIPIVRTVFEGVPTEKASSRIILNPPIRQSPGTQMEIDEVYGMFMYSFGKPEPISANAVWAILSSMGFPPFKVYSFSWRILLGLSQRLEGRVLREWWTDRAYLYYLSNRKQLLGIDAPTSYQKKLLKGGKSDTPKLRLLYITEYLALQYFEYFIDDSTWTVEDYERNQSEAQRRIGRFRAAAMRELRKLGFIKSETRGIDFQIAVIAALLEMHSDLSNGQDLLAPHVRSFLVDVLAFDKELVDESLNSITSSPQNT